MRGIIMLATMAGRRLAADGVPLIGSRYARRVLVLSATLTVAMVAGMVYLGVSAMPAMAASISDTSPGTAAPPTTLGPYDMTPFADDTRGLFEAVTDVPAPGGSVLQFNPSLNHRQVGQGWATWSHGYTGDVYVSGGTQRVMTLPENTKAFYFYVEPNLPIGSFNVTATADDGTISGPIPVAGASGAQYFGFYTTDGSSLSTIQVDVDPEANGFAVGEFGIAYGPTDTTPPTVTDTTPDGTVSRTATVTATFDEEVQNVTSSTFILERQIAAKVKKDPPKYVLVDATVDLIGGSYVLDPVQDLPKGNYRATITTDVTDMADPANALADPVVWTFKVEN
jgi:Bacterial Ig-like domain